MVDPEIPSRARPAPGRGRSPSRDCTPGGHRVWSPALITHRPQPSGDVRLPAVAFQATESDVPVYILSRSREPICVLSTTPPRFSAMRRCRHSCSTGAVPRRYRRTSSRSTPLTPCASPPTRLSQPCDSPELADFDFGSCRPGCPRPPERHSKPGSVSVRSTHPF